MEHLGGERAVAAVDEGHPACVGYWGVSGQGRRRLHAAATVHGPRHMEQALMRYQGSGNTSHEKHARDGSEAKALNTHDVRLE